MAFLSIIRRWHPREHVPIREISRRTGVSRNTVRKYLRAETVEPKFKVPDRASKLDPFSAQLTAWLKREAGRSRKQKGTLRQLYLNLVALGYDGSYNRVRLLPGSGERNASHYSRPVGEAPLCLWPLRRAKPSSSIGARTTP